MLPNFIIAGAAKSGSSTLYYYLQKHPEILMSKYKEPAYFTKYWNRKDLRWYENQFKHWNGEKAIGEATVEYMVDQHAPERIYKLVPHVKLIFIMRNPIDRAWSHYWHRVKMGEESRSFNEIIKNIENGNLDEYIIRYGMYATSIKRFLEYFSKEQVKFIILENFKENPSFFLKDIYRFLEVSDNININYKGARNKAKIYRIKHLSILWAKIRSMDPLKENLPSFIYHSLRKIFRFIDALNKKPFNPPIMDEKHCYILRNVFKGEVAELSSILNEDMAEKWKI